MGGQVSGAADSPAALSSAGGSGAVRLRADDAGRGLPLSAIGTTGRTVCMLATQPYLRGGCQRPVLIVADRLFDLFAGSHHERAVLDDGLVQRLAREQQEARAFFTGNGFQVAFGGEQSGALRRHLRRADAYAAFVRIDKSVVAALRPVRERRSR